MCAVFSHFVEFVPRAVGIRRWFSNLIQAGSRVEAVSNVRKLFSKSFWCSQRLTRLKVFSAPVSVVAVQCGIIRRLFRRLTHPFSICWHLFGWSHLSSGAFHLVLLSGCFLFNHPSKLLLWQRPKSDEGGSSTRSTSHADLPAIRRLEDYDERAALARRALDADASAVRYRDLASDG